MIKSIRIEPSYQASNFFLALSFLALVFFLFFVTGESNVLKSAAMSESEKNMRINVLLRTCFPDGVYKNAAAPCETFREYVKAQADLAEKDFQP